MAERGGKVGVQRSPGGQYKSAADLRKRLATGFAEDIAPATPAHPPDRKSDASGLVTGFESFVDVDAAQTE
jgi:hypothetical protein